MPTREYDDFHNLLERETQPESGATVFTYVGGNLDTKSDANGTVFRYLYDGNDRLKKITAGGRMTEISYEAGSDNRESATVAGKVASTFAYDTPGRLKQRDDWIAGETFTRRFEYWENDALGSAPWRPFSCATPVRC